MSSILRNAVSKQKRRYQKDGYDLDLSYITPRIIAMGFPSEKMEGVFRNPMKEVVKFLDHKHKDHFKVYNLCSERDYDHSKFYGRVGHFPFDDHNAPEFSLIEKFCQDVHEWLRDKDNIAVIHCKAGKGRTGLMICCYLIYCGEWPETENSLKFYAAARTYNQKGVTIPSQIRYVHYFSRYLREKLPYNPPERVLRKIVLKPLPNVANLGDINFNVCVGKKTVFNSKEDQLNTTVSKQDKKKGKKKDNGSSSSSSSTAQLTMTKQQSQSILSSLSNSTVTNFDQQAYNQHYGRDAEDHDEYISFDIGKLPVRGDVRVEVCEKGDRLFMFWVNTSFVSTHEVVIKPGLDKANKDKKHKNYPQDFRVELTFDEQTEHSTIKHDTVVIKTEASAFSINNTGASSQSHLRSSTLNGGGVNHRDEDDDEDSSDSNDEEMN
ncbi:hypothetical protein SAMD00019534_007800 [Acytostelium subglobosum LB1]|uniref:hypothetical protein n=1 Tax=Acytostelium subglobosum LB1 TaxID=1410327 RepID=UPI000644B274|nr:hypothetical protein SAMD00019534_007800 [Acytostelium subglobosum LB1]GAM17605.1 hypothetical protein SAMD00019534_007800 [Acytostelium subglobosum LB1]|eukprot:XP_012758201.1 hypothetical protein SAMD00019534_007800 [Acytostelium subglobosum LB1]